MVRAGRPERPVDPADGPVQSFAHGLRELRRQAGNPSYRTLAERTHYSRTVVSDAARGERLPTLAVTLAYVAACDGNADEWRARWHLCHQQITESGVPVPVGPAGELAAIDGDAGMRVTSSALLDAADGTTPAEAPPPSLPARRRSLAVPVLVGLAVLMLAQIEAAVVWHEASTQATRNAALATAAAASAPVAVRDGADPGTSNCGPSAVVLDSRPVVLPVSAKIGGHLVPKGTVLGTVELRYSRACGGAWARFDPAGGIFGSDTTEGAVMLTVLRPADGTMNQWLLPHIDEAYSDLLLTGMGCVVARGEVKIVGTPITGTAQTACLPRT